MTTLRIVGWNYGLQKVSMTKTLQKKLALGLKESKQITDAVLDGEIIILEIESEELAEDLANELIKIGAKVEIESNSLIAE
jgi:ribosomal protein L7/L12